MLCYNLNPELNYRLAKLYAWLSIPVVLFLQIVVFHVYGLNLMYVGLAVCVYYLLALLLAWRARKLDKHYRGRAYKRSWLLQLVLVLALQGVYNFAIKGELAQLQLNDRAIPLVILFNAYLFILLQYHRRAELVFALAVVEKTELKNKLHVLQAEHVKLRTSEQEG